MSFSSHPPNLYRHRLLNEGRKMMPDQSGVIEYFDTERTVDHGTRFNGELERNPHRYLGEAAVMPQEARRDNFVDNPDQMLSPYQASQWIESATDGRVAGLKSSPV